MSKLCAFWQTAFRMMAACLALGVLVQAGTPQGWFVAGDNRRNYQSDTDAAAAYSGHPSVYLKAIKPDDSGFGTLMQQFNAEQYRGKRVRFTAFVKSDNVAQWAGLWMRIDKGVASVGFDNMQDRPIKGSSNWATYNVVLDVPKEATQVAFGLLLAGGGTVWISNAEFEVVGSEVAVTGKQPNQGPANLNFESR